MTKVKTVNEQTDALYHEALDSLKKLNEEILLNKMNEDFNRLLHSLKDEVANFSETIKDDFALLSGSMNRATASGDNNTKETIDKLQQNSDFFFEKLQGFSKFFQEGVKSIVQTHSQLNNHLLSDIQGSIAMYNESFQSINDKHETLTAKTAEQNDQLENLVQNFSSEIMDNKSILDTINANWLSSIEHLTAGLQKQFEQIQAQIEGSNSFYEKLKIELLNEVQALSTLHNQIIEQIKLNTATIEKSKHEFLTVVQAQTAKIEQQSVSKFKKVLKTISDVKNEFEQINAQNTTKVDEHFVQLVQENEALKKQLTAQQALIENNAKTNTIFQSVILFGVIVLAVLQFVM